MQRLKTPRIKYAVAGALAGGANGLFGAGGGMILVPLFARWAGLEEKKAYATSIAVILPVSAVSAAVYFLRLRPDVSGALPYLIGGLVGGFFGGRVFKKVPAVLLRRVFALLLIYGGVRCFI